MVENNNAASFGKKFSLGGILRSIKNRIPELLLISGVLLGVGTGFLLYKDSVNKKKDTDYLNSIKDKVSISSTTDPKTVVQQFGSEKGEYAKELQSSNSATWDKAKLDKAYFNLLYADKVGSFSEVYSMLFFINTAKQSGLNIDDNSYGVTQQQRDDIKMRADKLAEDSKQGTSQ